MTDIEPYDRQQEWRDFATSPQWRQFAIRFAANFYPLSEDRDEFPDWYRLAYENRININLLIQAIDIVSNAGQVTFPAITAVENSLKKLKSGAPTYDDSIDCNYCNNTRKVHIVSAIIKGNRTLLKQDSPIACIAYPYIADCSCVGGHSCDVEHRFEPPKENGVILKGCEHISQRTFIDKCGTLLRNQHKTDYRGGAGRPKYDL